jgi:predicted nucleic acid-binding protein
MSLVIDSSIVAAWCFADETSTLADRVLDRLNQQNAVAPELLWYEVRNALFAGERRKRLGSAAVDTFLTGLDALPIRLEKHPEGPPLMRLARQHGLTIYDAAYLELASRTGLALATLDRALAAAARAEGVKVLA